MKDETVPVRSLPVGMEHASTQRYGAMVRLSAQIAQTNLNAVSLTSPPSK